MKKFDERRQGKFFIHRRIIENEPEKLEEVFRQVIVYRAECRLDRDAVEYLAFCSEFEPKELGTEPPEYQVVVSESCVIFEKVEVK